MRLQKPLNQFLIFLLPEQFNSKNNKAKNKNEKTGPVNPMHIPNPFRFGLVRIGFPDVEILR